MNSVKYLLFDMELFCDMFGSVLECYELTHISWSSLIPRQDQASLSTPQLSRESCMSEQALLPHCYPIGWVIKSTQYVVVVQLLTFLNLHFIMEWLVQPYFS